MSLTSAALAAWRDERKNSIGASDTSSLIGLGFGTPLRVYDSKVNDSHWHGNDATRIGSYLEPYVGKRYEEATGRTLGNVNYQIYKDGVIPAHATPDFSRSDGLFVQAKTVGVFNDEWGDTGSDQIPAGYRVQVVQEMACTKTSEIDVAALSRMTGEFRLYKVLFDKDLWSFLSDVICEFWQKFVEKECPPPANWADQFTTKANALTIGKAIELGPEIAELCQRRQKFAEIAKNAEKQADELKEKIRKAMGDAETAKAGVFKLKRSLVAPRHVEYDARGYEVLKVTASRQKITE